VISLTQICCLDAHLDLTGFEVTLVYSTIIISTNSLCLKNAIKSISLITISLPSLNQLSAVCIAQLASLEVCKIGLILLILHSISLLWISALELFVDVSFVLLKVVIVILGSGFVAII
jgi:hypothetical protein